MYIYLYIYMHIHTPVYTSIHVCSINICTIYRYAPTTDVYTIIRIPSYAHINATYTIYICIYAPYTDIYNTYAYAHIRMNIYKYTHMHICT